jgi:hypothetical protein
MMDDSAHNVRFRGTGKPSRIFVTSPGNAIGILRIPENGDIAILSA